MTNPAGNPMDAVAGLMLERQRYEAWIAQLEAKRAITPPHVFERVRADYEARLKAVIEQLSGRTTELRDTIAALTTRLAQLQQEEGKLRDERYEAELRAAVGEFTPAQWKELVERSDAELARRSSERTSVSSELARLQQILSMAGNRQGEAGGSASDGTAAAPASTIPGFVSGSAPPNFDELAFLKSVIDPRAEGAAGGLVPPAGVPSTGNPAANPPQRASSTPAAPRGGVVPPTPAAGAPMAPRPRQGVDTAASPTEEKPAEAVPEEPEVPAFLKDVPVEHVKTLRCAECGSMNYPTEWYCERCGAELTSM